MSGHQVNESPGTAVQPTSLFEAQLKFRLGPTARTDPATSIVETNATLNGTLLSSGQADTTIQIYWGQTNGSTNPGAWAAVANLGTQETGAFSAPLSGLVAGATYHYRVRATNSYYDVWADETETFTIPGPPSVTATGASSTQSGQATLHGILNGGTPANVTVVWSTTDHGTASLADWPLNQRVTIPNQSDGPLSALASSLVSETTYFYRIHAINHLGEAWSDVRSFEDFVKPVISLLQNDVSGTSSFNASLNWSDGLAPSSGKDYIAGFQLRAPGTTTANQNFTFAGDSLSINTGGTLVWQGSSSYLTGSITVNNLILNGGGISSFRSSTTHTIIGNINVTAQSNLNLGSGVSLTTTRDMNLNSRVTGSSRLVMNAQNAQPNRLQVNGNNSEFSGGFLLTGTDPTYNNSLLTVGHANALGTGMITINQGILDLNGFNVTISGLAGTNTSGNAIQNNSNTAATLTLATADVNSYAGSIQNGTGSLGLTKLGPGSLVLSGASTYTGTTLISEGDLEITGSLSNSQVIVENNATLAGNGNLGGSLTVKTGGIHQLNLAATPASQISRVIAGNLTLETDNKLIISATAPPVSGTYILATASGGITGSIGSYDLPEGVFGTVTIDGNHIALTVTEGTYTKLDRRIRTW